MGAVGLLNASASAAKTGKCSVKRYQTRVLNIGTRLETSDRRGIWLTVKKVPNGRFWGLDPGEIALGDFSFRLKKSRKWQKGLGGGSTQEKSALRPRISRRFQLQMTKGERSP